MLGWLITYKPLCCPSCCPFDSLQWKPKKTNSDLPQRVGSFNKCQTHDPTLLSFLLKQFRLVRKISCKFSLSSQFLCSRNGSLFSHNHLHSEPSAPSQSLSPSSQVLYLTWVSNFLFFIWIIFSVFNPKPKKINVIDCNP